MPRWLTPVLPAPTGRTGASSAGSPSREPARREGGARGVLSRRSGRGPPSGGGEVDLGQLLVAQPVRAMNDRHRITEHEPISEHIHLG